MKATPELPIERRRPVAVLTMNRPEKRNALNNALTTALLEALRAADADGEVSCVVLTGAGPGFCAGADLAEFKDLTSDQQRLVENRAELTMRLHQVFSRMTKPVVTELCGRVTRSGLNPLVAAGRTCSLMASLALSTLRRTSRGIASATLLVW
jgi:enoyl-CoA hydratase/carnithine racemase